MKIRIFATMNKVEARQEEIRNILSMTDSIRVEILAKRLDVTGATIRSDLREMEHRHEIYRSRGGVSLARPLIVDKNVNEKIFINASAKTKIAAAAATLIDSNDIILLTSGSTIEILARTLNPKGKLTVVTPSVAVSHILSDNDNMNIFMLGGMVRHTSCSVRDDYTYKGLENVCCNKIFFGCDGFDFGTGVITATGEEARLTSHMMKTCGKHILLTDSSKFGKTGFGKICDLRDLDIIICDSDIPEKVRSRLEELGIKVIIV